MAIDTKRYAEHYEKLHKAMAAFEEGQVRYADALDAATEAAETARKMDAEADALGNCAHDRQTELIDLRAAVVAAAAEIAKGGGSGS